MNLRIIAFLALLLVAAPVLADKLVFDHRLSPPLQAVLDGGDAVMVSYDDHNPKYVVDVIAVRGKSAKHWTEALVIIARTPGAMVRDATGWAAELQAEAQAKCASSFTALAQDANSLTFERRSSGCPKGYPPVAIYRVFGGKGSLFLLAAMARDGFDPAARTQWLAVLGSAHLD